MPRRKQDISVKKKEVKKCETITLIKILLSVIIILLTMACILQVTIVSATFSKPSSNFDTKVTTKNLIEHSSFLTKLASSSLLSMSESLPVTPASNIMSIKMVTENKKFKR